MSATTNHAAAGAPARALDVERVREEFPILRETVHGKPLVYLDNAASAQKPRAVIEAEAAVYETYYSNIHRGVHSLSMRATDAYEAAREKARRFLGAAHTREIVFTRGTTESINLVASSYGRRHVGRDDEVLITGWSTTRTSCPGRCCARRRAPACAWPPWTTAGT